MAVDADSRATPPGSGRRQSAGSAVAGRGGGDSEGTGRDQGGESPAAPAAPTAAKVPATTPEPAATTATASRRAEGPAMSEPEFRRVEWPGFRGPDRDGIVRGVRIETDWSKSPPVELWRRPIGPGWSSFAVDGDVLYTQEQRGEHEVVACLQGEHRPAGVATPRRGALLGVERRRRSARDADAQPRSRLHVRRDRNPQRARTPAAARVIWSRNAATDTGVEVPVWGFASSPLVVGDLVVVAAAGRLVAYDAATGQAALVGPRRAAPATARRIWRRSTASIRSCCSGEAAPSASRRPTAACSGSTSGNRASGSCSRLWPTTDDVLITTGDAMGGRRHPPHRGIAHGPGGMDRRGALDVARAEAVFQ